EIADFLEESAQVRRIAGLARAVAVEGVDPTLEIIALGEQGRVFRRESGKDRRRAGPEGRRVDVGAGKRALFDEGGEWLRDLEARLVDHIAHAMLLCGGA